MEFSNDNGMNVCKTCATVNSYETASVHIYFY